GAGTETIQALACLCSRRPPPPWTTVRRRPRPPRPIMKRSGNWPPRRPCSITSREGGMARRSGETCRVQVYLSDPKVVTGLNREARAGRMALSQAAGRAIARGLQNKGAGEAEDRLETLERALRDHMRSTARDMQIVQELLVEM